MNEKVSDLLGQKFIAKNGNVFSVDKEAEQAITPSRCVEVIEQLQEYIADSPALHTLAREVEVPDRHTIRTLIEEMEIAVNKGVTPAQLGFWISELVSVGSS
jgi:hypothetical protein